MSSNRVDGLPTDGTMQKVTGEPQALPREAEPAGESAAAGTGDIGELLGRVNPSLAALVTWIICLPVAYVGAKLGPADPFRLRVAMIPVVVLIAGVIVAGVASRRLSADLASGIGAGLFGGWVAFTLRVALHGTPFGFGGLVSDAGRTGRTWPTPYSHTWHSADGIVPSVPSNYPPLFPWLVGRASALTSVPAWKLLGPAEAITLSFAVVAGYILWRRLLPGPLALAVTLPVLLGFSLPEKAYEILALAVLVPWAIATFGDPPRGRLALAASRADRWPDNSLVLGVPHLRGAGHPGAGRADLAGQPGPGPVCPARGADDRRQLRCRLLVPGPLSGLGTAAWIKPGGVPVPGRRDPGQPAAVPRPDSARRPGADRRHRAALVPGTSVVGETAAAADRRHLRLLAARPRRLYRGQPPPAAPGYSPADRPDAGRGGGADHRARRPRHRAPALHPHRPERAGDAQPCACSASLSPSPHGRRGCRAPPPRSAGYTSRL